MTPQMVEDFETRVRRAIDEQLPEHRISVDYVDNVSAVEGSHGRVLVVDFHLEGEPDCDDQFTFPFDASVPLEQSLSILDDMIVRSHRSPGAPRTR